MYPLVWRLATAHEEGEYVEEEEGDGDGWYDEDDDAEGVTDDWYA